MAPVSTFFPGAGRAHRMEYFMLQVVDFSLGPLETNCYLIHTDTAAVAVDPGGPPAPVLAFCKERSLTLTHILLTHLHFDHTAGVADLVAATGASVLGSGFDRYMLDTEMGRGGCWGLPSNAPFDFSDTAPGDLSLLDTVCTVLATPGHSPGGLSFYFPALGAVFCGDALFYRSVGRTDFPRGSQSVLVASIRNVLFSLPEETTVYCGHGLATSIGDEKKNNPYVSDFSRV